MKGSLRFVTVTNAAHRQLKSGVQADEARSKEPVVVARYRFSGTPPFFAHGVVFFYKRSRSAATGISNIVSQTRHG